MRFALDVRTGHLVNVAMIHRLEGGAPALERMAARYEPVPARLDTVAEWKLRVGTTNECIETAISLAQPATNALSGWANAECKRKYPDFYNQLRRTNSIWQKTK